MLWIRASDGALINLAAMSEIVVSGTALYAIGTAGRHKLADEADGAVLADVLTAIETALGATGYSGLGGVIPPAGTL